MTLSLPEDPTDDDALVETFTEWAAGRGLSLYPHQEEALIEVVTGSHVIASTPTGSGKSLIAVAAHYVALARGQRTYYTAPLKALVSEKFFDLVDIFGAEQVASPPGARRSTPEHRSTASPPGSPPTRRRPAGPGPVAARA